MGLSVATNPNVEQRGLDEGGSKLAELSMDDSDPDEVRLSVENVKHGEQSQVDLGGDEKTTMSVAKLSMKCVDKGGDGKDDLSMAGLSSVQDEDLGEIPDMSVAKLSMQGADTWGDSQEDLSMPELSGERRCQGNEIHTSAEGTDLLRKEQSDTSVAKLSSVKCANCRRTVRRMRGWRVSNMVRVTWSTEVELSAEQQELDDQFPENFSEIVSLQDFKVRKKSLLRKQLQEMRKKMNDQLPEISEAGELRVVYGLTQW